MTVACGVIVWATAASGRAPASLPGDSFKITSAKCAGTTCTIIVTNSGKNGLQIFYFTLPQGVEVLDVSDPNATVPSTQVPPDPCFHSSNGGGCFYRGTGTTIAPDKPPTTALTIRVLPFRK